MKLRNKKNFILGILELIFAIISGISSFMGEFNLKLLLLALLLLAASIFFICNSFEIDESED